jgi:hypothetical protein
METISSYQASSYLKVSDKLQRTKQQLDQYRSGYETQALLIKTLQDELGEDAEFNKDDDPRPRGHPSEKNSELRDERSQLKRQQEIEDVEG